MTTTLILLIILGVVFVGMVIGLRYYTHKTMTERVCSRNPNSEYCVRYYRKKLDKSQDQYKHCDVVYGETPSGGVKTVICYVDDHNKMVKKKRANKVLVRELDKKNQPVYETWTPLEEIEKLKAEQKKTSSSQEASSQQTKEES